MTKLDACAVAIVGEKSGVGPQRGTSVGSTSFGRNTRETVLQWRRNTSADQRLSPRKIHLQSIIAPAKKSAPSIDSRENRGYRQTCCGRLTRMPARVKRASPNASEVDSVRARTGDTARLNPVATINAASVARRVNGRKQRVGLRSTTSWSHRFALTNIMHREPQFQKERP